MKVALGAAKGLAFLHSDKAKVIYRDFKTSNVLLDAVLANTLLFSVFSYYLFMINSSFQLGFHVVHLTGLQCKAL